MSLHPTSKVITLQYLHLHVRDRVDESGAAREVLVAGLLGDHRTHATLRTARVAQLASDVRLELHRHENDLGVGLAGHVL
jgi:hypothetical protein